MRDVFYTILVVWILWRVVSSFNSYNARKSANNNNPVKPVETRIKNSSASKKKMTDNEGEYVDYEEIK